MQSCMCNLTQQPQFILWKLHAVDNTPRQNAMQHQKAGSHRRGEKIRSSCLTPAFSGRNCCVTPIFSGVPNAKRGGGGSEVIASPVPSRGPKRGRNCYVTPAFSGVPNAKRGEKIRSGHLTPTISGAQKRAGLLRNPCILRGPQKGVQ